MNKSIIDDFLTRVKENKPTRWVRFGLVSTIFFLWVAWMGNWWLSIFWLLLLDIYITGYIPFTWWKKSPNPLVRSIMSWVDAIVYALVLVYFIFSFVGQNYMIPSSSLEKTLLTGDYLVVDKVTYGPRVPMTPVHMPLVHNKLPILNCDSYLDHPSNSYRRLKGLRNVEAGDIVVFNFPAGDTIAAKFEETANYYDLVATVGRERVHADKETFGEIKYRPVDRRTNYVKRCVGLPGQNFKIVDDVIYIDGKPQPQPEHAQWSYFISTSRPLNNDMLDKYGINPVDVSAVIPEYMRQLAVLAGFSPSQPAYQLPLTAAELKRMEADGLIVQSKKVNDIFRQGVGAMYGGGNDWSLSDWGGDAGVIIPKKGMTVPLDSANWALYQRCIRNYENHHDAYFKGGQAYIDGAPSADYTFAMDYYFMMGDNRDNSLDSRFWGFVPEDHIVGTPRLVLASFDPNKGLFSGKIRTDRIFRDPNPDK